MKRDQFIRRVLAGTTALFAVNWGTMAEIRQYKQQNKPLLTEANLNRFFIKCKEENDLLPYEEAIKDTKYFLEKYFSISPAQKNTISRMNAESWNNIQSIIKDAKDDKGTVNFKFVQYSASECSTEVRLMQQASRNNLPNQSTKLKRRVVRDNRQQLEIRKIVIQ